MAFSETGKNFGFIADLDTTKVLVRPNELYLWHEGMTRAEKLVDANSSPEGYRVSADGDISFSKDETKMFFGLAIPPIVKDTTLLDEEIVNVEVWTYNEPRLYTMQELQLQQDKKKSYTAVINLNANNTLIQIATTEYPNSTIGNEGNATYALVNNPKPYELEGHWQGISARDYSIVNTMTGETMEALTKAVGRINLSPEGKYIYGYNSVDTTWFTYNIATAKLTSLTIGKIFYNEINDRPNYPNSYGIAGWTENDASVLIYDRYDIWEFNPENNAGTRITNGRENKVSYRYVELDQECSTRFIEAIKRINIENPN